jgi:hypothetical protein
MKHEICMHKKYKHTGSTLSDKKRQSEKKTKDTQHQQNGSH